MSQRVYVKLVSSSNPSEVERVVNAFLSHIPSSDFVDIKLSSSDHNHDALIIYKQ
ncbi:hypothetical protein [Paenibacillus polymyxa]|uniref:hypothetical protein n=1 Tax=Paenibacillus polymyxa TaxID=1406 RepID=UPI000A6F2509|nr:hypothetical protein [Paenibacillus polymyxa]